jgi:iron complex transport system substrate-binding protein
MRMSFLFTAAVIIAIFFSAAGCARIERRDIFDRTGRKVSINGPLNRIISSAPSNTEIIVDLGMADRLVAIDRYSSNIPGLPDGLVRLDFSYPDAEVILGLKPDIIIANGHNVTVSGDDPFRLLREMGIPVAYISMSRSIDDIYKDIAFIAELLQAKENGAQLIRSMKVQVDEISRTCALAKTKRSVYFEISAMPEMITFGKGSFLDDMISATGARNIFGGDSWVLSPSAEAIIERNPDVILTNVDYIDDPIGELKNRYGFDHINAVKNDRVCRIDLDSSVRPSARIILALEQMARAVYPEIYEKQ